MGVVVEIGEVVCGRGKIGEVVCVCVCVCFFFPLGDYVVVVSCGCGYC